MKINDTFLSFQISILFRILNRILLKICDSKTNDRILTHALFKKNQRKQRRFFKEKTTKSKRYNQK